MKAVAVLAKYFNTNPDNKIALKDFAVEIRALSEDEKKELATLAAKELGVTLDE